MLNNEIVEVRETRWLIKQAISMDAAMDCIYSAMCIGSVGGTDTLDRTLCGGVKSVLAEVVQINSDGTERKPYTASY